MNRTSAFTAPSAAAARLFCSLGLLGFLAPSATAQPSHNLPATLAAPGAPIKTILTGLNGSGGIAADARGNVTVAETPSNRTWRIPSGGNKEAATPANGLTIRGMVYDAQGRLIFCQDDKLSYFDTAGAIHDLAVQRSGGGKLGQNNDLVVLDDGAVYFTNGEGNTIYYWKAGTDPVAAASGLNYPDGIEAREDSGKVYVTLFSRPYALVSFDIQPDHSLANKQVLATLEVPDGLVMDILGNFYVTSLAEACVAVYTPAGKELGRISVPGESIHNVAFGGAGNDTLYFTGEHASFKMPMRVTGQRDPFKAATLVRSMRFSGSAGDAPGGSAGKAMWWSGVGTPGFLGGNGNGLMRDALGRGILPARKHARADGSGFQIPFRFQSY